MTLLGAGDERLFLLINKSVNEVPVLAHLLEYLSCLFNISNFAIYYVLLILYLIYNNFINKKISKAEFNILYSNMIEVGTCYTIIGLLYSFLKFTVNSKRPFCSLDPNLFITIIDTNSERCLSSFPSSHTAIGLMVLYFSWRYLNIWFKILGTIIFLFLMISRISLAMHYPSDIIFSIPICLCVIILNKFILSLISNKITKPIGDTIYKKIINKI